MTLAEARDSQAPALDHAWIDLRKVNFTKARKERIVDPHHMHNFATLIGDLTKLLDYNAIDTHLLYHNFQGASSSRHNFCNVSTSLTVSIHCQKP